MLFTMAPHVLAYYEYGLIDRALRLWSKASVAGAPTTNLQRKGVGGPLPSSSSWALDQFEGRNAVESVLFMFMLSPLGLYNNFKSCIPDN